MRRAQFLASTAATASLCWALPAWASGGLDTDGPPDDTLAPAMAGGGMIRVLVRPDDATRYRGTLADAGSSRINTLSLEEYLLGVVPAEMPSAWPAAALQAQAIVARTYALRKCQAANLHRDYDVVAGTQDQMYGGINAESTDASRAIAATAGMTIMYSGALADVAYMSCCGGHTEDSQRLWGSNIPYLHGVPDPYCANTPDSNWTVTLDWNSVARSLHFDSDGTPQAVELVGLPGARPTSLRLISDGTSQDIDVYNLRRMYGGELPSTYIRNVTLQRDGDEEAKIVLTGGGRGHGVGLCQWGARGMALAGASAAQILAFYFPTTGWAKLRFRVL